MNTYRVTYENPIKSKEIENIKIFQYCTIIAHDMQTALQIFEDNFCWECVKIQKIN